MECYDISYFLEVFQRLGCEFVWFHLNLTPDTSSTVWLFRLQLPTPTQGTQANWLQLPTRLRLAKLFHFNSQLRFQHSKLFNSDSLLHLRPHEIFDFNFQLWLQPHALLDSDFRRRLHLHKFFDYDSQFELPTPTLDPDSNSDTRHRFLSPSAPE